MPTTKTYDIKIVGGNINTGFIYAIDNGDHLGLDRFYSRAEAYQTAEDRGFVPANDDVLRRRQSVLGY